MNETRENNHETNFKEKIVWISLRQTGGSLIYITCWCRKTYVNIFYTLDHLEIDEIENFVYIYLYLTLTGLTYTPRRLSDGDGQKKNVYILPMTMRKLYLRYI